ncbi:unnamed protein product [Closterium sp. NIES-65]|nr:unnamed protein product [Closterium sp. NIES-65]
MKLQWRVTTGSLLELAVTATGAAATGWFGVAFFNMKLHWKVTTGSLLELAVTATGAAATGWFSVAFSKSGGMVTADAVIANQGGSPVPVNTYAITSYSTVKATTAFGAGGKAFTGGTTATMKFTRSTGDGGVAPVNVRGSNRMVYAYSKSGAKTIAYHGSHYGVFTVDFSCNGSPVAPPPPPPPATNPPPPTGGTTTPPPPPTGGTGTPPPPPAGGAGSNPPPPTTSAPPPPPPPPSSFATGRACPASTLPGYAFQVALRPPK